MENIFDVLISSHYQDRPVYQGKTLFPYTGNVDADWLIFKQAIDFLLTVGQYTADDYFYWLLFSKKIFFETHEPTFKCEVLNKYVLETSNNFCLTANLGSLVPGYGLILPRSHVLSMSALVDDEKREYIEFLNYVRCLFAKAFGQRPMVFEHGSNRQDEPKSNSINHAHSHIISYFLRSENKMIDELEMRQLSSLEELLDRGQGNNYISYISPDDRIFYTDSCIHDSQLMRKYIAKDVGLEQGWDWHQNFFQENMFETAKGVVLQRVRNFDK